MQFSERAHGAGKTLNEVRLATVLAIVRASGATSVLDLGCGAGRLLQLLLNDKQFQNILGFDISPQKLKTAGDRLRLDRFSPTNSRRVRLLRGSMLRADERLAGFEMATCVEVIEHIEPSRLGMFESVVFQRARPGAVVVTTPNIEYNVRFETLAPGKLRHKDHRFEWTRKEFEHWAHGVAERAGYCVDLRPVGPVDAQVGAPTQMALFSLEDRGTRTMGVSYAASAGLPPHDPLTWDSPDSDAYSNATQHLGLQHDAYMPER